MFSEYDLKYITDTTSDFTELTGIHMYGKDGFTEEFKEEAVTEFVTEAEDKYKDQVTEGIFAPWIFNVDEFKAIGGHDEGFYPQSKEDSDIFNRFCRRSQCRQTIDGSSDS